MHKMKTFLSAAALVALATAANAGWVEGRSRMTFPESFRGTWCSLDKDGLFVKARNANACPAKSGDFIYQIGADGYSLEDDRCDVIRITVGSASSFDVRLDCGNGIIKTGAWRLERGKLRIKWVAHNDTH